MRLPTKLRQRLSYHGITYGLLRGTVATTVALLSTGAFAAVTVQHYTIAAGRLDNALSQFAAKANVILSFSPQQTASLSTPGLEGDYSVEQGFALLLQTSGLLAVVQAPGSYVLQAVPSGQLTLSPTTVSTYQQDGFNQEIAGDVGYKALNSRIGTKTSTPLSETPRSVSVVTGQRIKDQKSQTLTEVLGYVPGIFAPPFAAGDSLAGDLFFIRGFNATDYGYGLLRDGLRVQGNRYDTTSEPYGLERVEIFRGPSSLLYGENAPGGLVNLVSKHPTATPQGEVQLGYGSHNRRQVGVDISGPLNENGNILGRMVMLGRKSDTQTDHVPDDRLYIAPSLTLNFDDFNTLTLLANYQKDHTNLELGLPAAGTLLTNPNGKLSKHTMLGDPDWNTFEREAWNTGYEFSHSFNDDWQFRQNSRYMQSRITRHETWPGDLNNQGFGTQLNMNAYDRYNKSMVYSLDNQLEGKFQLGSLENTLLFGASYDRTSFNQDWDAGFAGTINVYDPVYLRDPTTPQAVQNTLLAQQMKGVYAQIQSKYDHWLFLLGGRQDWVDSDFRDKVKSATDSSTTEQKFTYQGGVMYQFDNGLTPYVSYSTAFVPVQQISVAGSPLKPISSRQYEVGLKYEPIGWDTAMTLSVYDLRKQDDTYLDSTTNTYRQVGESRAKGAELEINSNITPNLNLTAAYTYTDARITKDTAGSLVEGHQMTGVPRNQASVWGKYRFLDGQLKGLSLGGGVRYFDSAYSYTKPTLYGKLDPGSVTLVDAAIGYQIDTHWSIDLNAKNLFDKEYVSGCNDAGRCYWGDSRTLLGTVSYNW
ncbi:TonB-dependent siderophore receptor [Pseudomonas fluorescens]|uniref:TonB-dependent siderophore receptor n=1 Tax=Pseudomonas fluorescens TaxID=294 RepID=UPI00177D2384|nr:TonB-dependent siderophore receptor [Pseudomonas fluorescens]MBD8190956.1 TonB-dependent siderophore receptor [Pseudomonas fluorescens]MBD8226057.1 TonB-dependent siderophore receptor [Pseudomonas fluorescens]MBD8782705.1 TonB-dependent siderophore receptor [Pseudomonas fluorescens]MBD8816127.1 TonB-dependent siderophore receptor [Pseudomonas fluorescens]